MNEDLISNKFYYKIDPNATDTEIKKSLLDIYNTPLEELIERGKQSRVYFDTVIRDYFKDPTANFIQFLKFHEVI